MSHEPDKNTEPGFARDGWLRPLVHRLFLWSACGTVVLAPWLLGGEPLRAQWWLLGGALATFVSGGALKSLSRPSPGARTAWRVSRWAVLIGFAFLGLLFTQALNPSHVVKITGTSWRVVEIMESSGPSSVAGPFDTIPSDWLPYRNTWRYLLVFGAGWAYVTGLALGLVERDDARRWVTVVGVNAAVLGAVCLVHRLSGAQKTLWMFSDVFDFTASPVFFYKNHNGAYLAASLAVVLALAAGEKDARRRRWWEWSGLVLWIATVSVNSRTAIGCATLWGGLYLARRWRERREAGGRSVPGRRFALGAVGVAAVIGLLAVTGGGKAMGRFAPALSAPLEFLHGGHYRSLIRDIGLEMWRDRPVWGWGGGAYLYLFPSYHPRVPEVAQWAYREQPTLNRFVGPTVNCDWVEFGLEYGAVGLALLVVAAAVPLRALWRWKIWSDPAIGLLAAGALGIAAHGWFDYILRNLALLILFLGLLVVAVRLAAAREPVVRKPEGRRGRRVRV